MLEVVKEWNRLLGSPILELTMQRASWATVQRRFGVSWVRVGILI